MGEDGRPENLLLLQMIEVVLQAGHRVFHFLSVQGIDDFID